MGFLNLPLTNQHSRELFNTLQYFIQLLEASKQLQNVVVSHPYSIPWNTLLPKSSDCHHFQGLVAFLNYLSDIKNHLLFFLFHYYLTHLLKSSSTHLLKNWFTISLQIDSGMLSQFWASKLFFYFIFVSLQGFFFWLMPSDSEALVPASITYYNKPSYFGLKCWTCFQRLRTEVLMYIHTSFCLYYY